MSQTKPQPDAEYTEGDMEAALEVVITNEDGSAADFSGVLARRFYMRRIGASVSAFDGAVAAAGSTAAALRFAWSAPLTAGDYLTQFEVDHPGSPPRPQRVPTEPLWVRVHPKLA